MSRMTLEVALLVVVFTAASCSLVNSGSDAPHILLVVADDIGYADVGWHGSDIQTPTLDELAEGGIRLDSYYTQSYGSASRAALMTGKYPIRLGNVHGNLESDVPAGLPLSELTLASTLKDAGYSTHAVGKWHLGMYTAAYLPTRRGFDTFYGKLLGISDNINHTACMMFDGTSSCGIDIYDNETPVHGITRHSTNLFTKKAVRVVQNHISSKPMFLYLSYTAAHSPLQVPNKPRRYDQLYAGMADENMRKYAGMITNMDDGISEVVEAFKSRGIWNNTVMIFISDNGGVESSGASNLPFKGGKGSLWEGGARVPAFIHSPLLDASVQGSSNTDLVHVTDWLPSLVSLSGNTLNGRNSLDGFDVWTPLSKGEPGPRTEILHNIDVLHKKRGRDNYPGVFDTRIRAAMTQDEWKIITGDPDTTLNLADNELPFIIINSDVSITPMPGMEETDEQNVLLFNLKEDPSESTDLSSQNTDRVKKMLQRLSEYYSVAVPPVLPCPDPSANPVYSGAVWKSWLDEGQESSVQPLCPQHLAEYEKYRYIPAKAVPGQGGAGMLLIIYFVIIMCLLFFGTCLFCRMFVCKGRQKLVTDTYMDHE